MSKNILFDLGGVLYRIDYSLSKQAFESLGINQFDKHFSQKQQSALFDKLEMGHLEPWQFVESMKSILPKASKEQIISAWNAMLLGFTEQTIHLLKALSREHTLYLLSNTNAIHIKQVEDELSNDFGINSIKSLFTKTYLSHEIGRRKPNRETFEWVLKDANISPQETFYIDDSIQHIESAKEVGIKTLLWRQNKPIRALFPDTTLLTPR